MSGHRVMVRLPSAAGCRTAALTDGEALRALGALHARGTAESVPILCREEGPGMWEP